MSKLGIRLADESDRETVFEINCAAYHDVVVLQFGTWDVQFQRELFEKKWQPSKSILVLENNPVGCLSVETFSDHIF